MGYNRTEPEGKQHIDVCAQGSAVMINAGVTEMIRRFTQADTLNKETARLLESIGATLMGVKPASLINVHSDQCVKLCKTHFVCGGPVACVIVKATQEKTQLFFYHQGCLQAVLADGVNRLFLMRLGYPEQGTADQYVRILIQRMRGTPFPHEAGLFFGYPIKDVCGFMGAPIRYRKTMGWRMYGDTRVSEIIYERYKNARSAVRRMLRAYMEQRILSV